MAIRSWITILICVLTAVADTVLAYMSSVHLKPGEEIVVLFTVGPYLLLGVFAWWQRRKEVASWLLLGVALALAAGGLYVAGEHTYRNHTEPHFRSFLVFGV